MTAPGDKLSLLGHLLELRRRLIWSVIAVAVGAIVCFIFRDWIIYFLKLPAGNPELYRTQVTDAISVYMRVSFFGGGPRCPESFPFPSCLRACLDFMGEGHGHETITAHPSSVFPPFCHALMSTAQSFMILPIPTSLILSLFSDTAIPRRAASSNDDSEATAEAKKCSIRVPSKLVVGVTFPGLEAVTSSSIASSRQLEMCFAFSRFGIGDGAPVLR